MNVITANPTEPISAASTTVGELSPGPLSRRLLSQLARARPIRLLPVNRIYRRLVERSGTQRRRSR